MGIGFSMGSGLNVGGVSLGGSAYGGAGDLLAAGNSLGGMGGDTSGGGFESLIPGVGDAMAADAQNRANIAAADKAMKFSERMSSTAYQRSMEDMKKAGLNPMLSFSQGGASSPSGMTPTINAASKTGLANTAIGAFTSYNAQQTAQQQADTQQASAESSIKLNAANSAKTVADTQKIQVETAKARKDLPRADAEAKATKAATDFIEKQIKSLNSTGKNQSRGGEIMNTMKNGLKFMFGDKQQSQPTSGYPTWMQKEDWAKQHKRK